MGLRLVLAAVVLVTSVVPASAQRLAWYVTGIRGAVGGSPPGTRTVYGPARDQVLVFALKNEPVGDFAGTSVWLGPGFLGNLRVRATRDGQPIGIEREWTRIVMTRSDSDASPPELEVPPGIEMLLGPGDWVQFTLTIRPDGGRPLEEGLYEITLDTSLARGDVRHENLPSVIRQYLDMPGSMVAPKVAFLFAEPRTREELRLWRLVEANEALIAQQWPVALQHYQVLLSESPDDGAAHLGAGQVYSALGRYAEAVVHFEAVKHRPGPLVDSVLPSLLALAYIGAGDIDKARAFLSGPGAPDEQVEQAIARYRALLQKRLPQK